MKLYFKFNKSILILLFLMTTFPFIINTHTGSLRESNEKVWQLENVTYVTF
jgi:hypothetical protein